MANVKNNPVRRNAFADLGGAGGAAQFFAGQNPAGVADLDNARSIAIDQLDANPYQPRTVFDDTALAELAADIKEHGILQPLLVRPHPTEDGRYQIVAGERRWRAATLAGKGEAPCIERPTTDVEMERLALVENVQRADLDPVDEAHAYKRLMERLGLSVRDVAASVHKDHSYVVQRLLLIKDPRVEALTRAGTIGLSVAVGVARITDDTQRERLLDRAEEGERLTVEDVRGARALEQPTSAPDAPPAIEATMGDHDASVGKFTHSTPEDAPHVPPVPAPTAPTAPTMVKTREPLNRVRESSLTIDERERYQTTVYMLMRVMPWPAVEGLLEFGMAENMHTKTLLRLCRETRRAKGMDGTKPSSD